MAYGTAYHYLGDSEEAQDAAQEAFVHAYGHLRDLRDPAKFSPWLRRAVINACVDGCRRRALRREKEVASLPLYPPQEHLTTRLVVREALSCLSEKTRLTVTLFYGGGYSHAEIACFLDIPLNTVRSRLQHAKHQLREEMQAMVSDTLNENKPDETWTQQVVEEALRRGAEALRSYRNADAVRNFDEALNALKGMPDGEDRLRLKMEALWRKGDAIDPNRHGRVEALPVFGQAVAIAEELGDQPNQADKLTMLGGAYYNGGHKAEAEACYQKALAVYRTFGGTQGEAGCLTNLGILSLEDDAAKSGRLFAQALRLYQAIGNLGGVAYCRAMLDVQANVGASRLPQGIGFFFGCDLLSAKGGAITHKNETCYLGYYWPDDLARSPLRVQRVFWQTSHLGKILDTQVEVNGEWSGSAFTYSRQPLHATVAVKSAAEIITVPAGAFGNCLLTEQITTESDLPDDAPEEAKQANREEFCGVRRAWYAPGVGLVQLQVERGDGVEACIQLQQYAVLQESNDYLPLAIGNTWTYGWANVPEEYIAREVYRVMANEGELWYLEHYAYVDRRQGV